MSVIDATLKDFGSKYFQDIINRPKPPEAVKYNKNHLQIARKINSDGSPGDIYHLDIKETSRIIILGATRSGKTFFMRSMADRIKTLGDAVVLLLDIKNEFFSSNYPVQEKFRSGLLPGETPASMRVVTLRPTFFKQLDDKKPKSNFWFSIDSKKLSRADFMSLMNINELSPTQKTSMELVFQDFQKKIGANPNTQLTYECIEQIIDENKDMDVRQKQILKFKFKPLQSSSFVEEEYAKSIVTLLKKGFVPAINLENFENFGKGNFSYPEVLLNITYREIVVARRAKKIPRTWVFLDEASRFIGNSKRNSFKDSILECLEENTLVKTNKGDKKIKDLDSDNDKVISFDGKKLVESEFHCFGEDIKDVYEIELEDGRKILATKNHRFFDENMKEIKIKDLNIGDELTTI